MRARSVAPSANRAPGAAAGAQVLRRDPSDDEVARLIGETPENVRAARQMTSTEVSLDAPVDRSDREASTLGERFSGVDGTEIEDVTGLNPAYTADREMANAPSLTANGALNYLFPAYGNYRVGLQWDWNYAAERYTDNFNHPASLIEAYFKHVNSKGGISLNLESISGIKQINSRF